MRPGTNPGISIAQIGGELSIAIATGSHTNGTRDRSSGGRTLGASSAVRLGLLNVSGSGPVRGNVFNLPSANAPFYGLSQIFQVEVPPVLPVLPTSCRNQLILRPWWWSRPAGSWYPKGWERAASSGCCSSPPPLLGRQLRHRRLQPQGPVQGRVGPCRPDRLRRRFPGGGQHRFRARRREYRHRIPDASPGVPVYWVKGKKVADDYADFYDRSWDEEREGRNARGEALRRFSRPGLESSGVWTGIGAGHELGTSEVVMGLPNKNPDDYDRVTEAGPLNSNFLGDGEPDSQGRGPGLRAPLRPLPGLPGWRLDDRGSGGAHEAAQPAHGNLPRPQLPGHQ